MAEHRHLPVLPPTKPAPAASTDGERPPWHWVGFGVVATFALWLPLSYVAQAVASRMLAARHLGEGASAAQLASELGAMGASERARLTVLLAIPHLLALGLAAFGGGVLVGRFGVGAGVREAALSGALTALAAVGLSCMSAGGSWSSILVVAVAVAFAAFGGKVGSPRRR